MIDRAEQVAINTKVSKSTNILKNKIYVIINLKTDFKMMYKKKEANSNLCKKTKTKTESPRPPDAKMVYTEDMSL